MGGDFSFTKAASVPRHHPKKLLVSDGSFSRHENPNLIKPSKVYVFCLPCLLFIWSLFRCSSRHLSDESDIIGIAEMRLVITFDRDSGRKEKIPNIRAYYLLASQESLVHHEGLLLRSLYAWEVHKSIRYMSIVDCLLQPCRIYVDGSNQAFKCPVYTWRAFQFCCSDSNRNSWSMMR